MPPRKAEEANASYPGTPTLIVDFPISFAHHIFRMVGAEETVRICHLAYLPATGLLSWSSQSSTDLRSEQHVPVAGLDQTSFLQHVDDVRPADDRLSCVIYRYVYVPAVPANVLITKYASIAFVHIFRLAAQDAARSTVGRGL